MKNFLGELIGTFVLVFVGLFSVYGAVIEEWFGLYVVASIWVVAVFLGIITSRNLSPAHLNPAVTFGFIATGAKFEFKNLVGIFLGQLLGAFLAGSLVFFLFKDAISDFELLNDIVKGEMDSVRTAMVFGEFYPNPAGEQSSLPTWIAALLEGGGTFLLMTSILICVKKIKSKNLTAFLIALTVGVLIVFVAPYTQAGFNPARDLMPRIVSSLMGWKDVVWGTEMFSPVLVYVIAPIFGAVLAGVLKVVLGMMKTKRV